MSTLLIGYDLNRAKNYPDLIDAIKSLGAWWHHLDSTWLVNTSLSPQAVRDKLAQFLDKDDELLVINVTGDARAWTGFSASGSDWLRDTFQ